ncbi:SUMF1/EgtB/PvdO family nonheme iron enzyme [Treponema sp.]|uniref:SUMF1/EgtB/PvdO family nonheme iron enzyme n=1 Tax=Treponema sp. TaxID=166 RepID=UPI003FD74D6E
MQNNKKYILFFKKNLFVLLISLTFFCGCQNNVQENTNPGNANGKTLSVAVNFSNFPATNLIKSNSLRSAHPSAENLSSCVFKATLTCGTETSVESTASTPSDQNYVFSFPNFVNSAEKTYTLDVSVYSGNKKIATGTSSFTVPAFTEKGKSSVTLKALTTEGLPHGNVSLKLKLEDGLNDRIKYVHYEFINTDPSKNITGLSSRFTQDSTDSKYYATISNNSISAGVYSLNLKFTLESTETNIIYFRKETVNIWSGMTTDYWYLSQGLVSDTLEITNSMLFDTYYVCGTNSEFFTSILGTDETGSDTDGDGSLKKPYATVQPALDKILAANDGATEYTIYVGGTVKPSSVVNGALAYATDIDKKLKLNIVGITEDNSQNILDASLCSTRTKNLEFNIKSGSTADVTVTIKNLSLTGATGVFGGAVSGTADFIFDNVHAYNNRGDYGGVIFSDGSGNVTLQNGTVFGNKDVTEAATSGNYSNSSTCNSGAIRLFDGTLTIKKGCYVSGNYSNGSNTNAGGGISVQGTGKVILEKGAFVQYNTVGTYCGGGIYLQTSGSSAEIYGTIQGNKAPNGGGIYAKKGTTVTLNGATISNNATFNNGNGGGFYSTDSTVYLTDCNFTSNNSDKNGGGLYITGSSTLKLENCNFSDNSTKNESPYDYYGSALFIGSSSNTDTSFVDATINNCTFSENNAYSYGTIAVYRNGNSTNPKTVKIIGNTKITDNTSKCLGNAIFIESANVQLGEENDSTFPTINGNNSTNDGSSRYGGAITIYDADATFTMYGGEIKNNTNDATGGKVGGVFVGGTFNFYGGSITDNTKENITPNDINLGDINSYSSAKLNIKGAAKAGRIYLPTGKKITIEGELTKSEVATATIEPSSYTEGTQVLESSSATPDYVSSHFNLFNIAPDVTDTNFWYINTSGKLVKFIKVKGKEIIGTETWTPESKVFVSGRKLTIPTLLVSDHEVTRKEFLDVMGFDPSTAKAFDANKNELTGDAALNNPVNYVNWYDAIAYCNKLSIKEGLTPCYKVEGVDFAALEYSSIPSSKNNEKWDAATCDFTANGYRLPTEAEWEYLARGDKDYTYAGSNTLNDVAWYESNTDNTGTREVKTKQANGYGLYDMSGNVCEWCWDWYDSPISNMTDDAGPAFGSSSFRVRRGGSWSSSVDYCAVSRRFNFGFPYLRSNSYGLRVVRNAN